MTCAKCAPRETAERRLRSSSTGAVFSLLCNFPPRYNRRSAPSGSVLRSEAETQLLATEAVLLLSHSVSDSMKQVTYWVVSREGAWSVRFNEKYFGPCASKSQALSVAISAATKALLLKCSARVLVEQGESLAVVWSNGRFAKQATPPSQPNWVSRLTITVQSVPGSAASTLLRWLSHASGLPAQQQRLRRRPPA